MTGGRVSCMKLSRAAYAALESKDPDTLYCVNNDGNFGEENMDADGDIYLGGKLLTGQPVVPPPFNSADPMANPQGVFYVVTDAGSTTAAWTATLQGLTAYYAGLRLAVFNTVAGDTQTTLNVNSLGAVPVKRNGGEEQQDAIAASSVTTLTYTVVGNEPAFLIDSYVNNTYELRNLCMTFQRIAAGAAGVFQYGLCAFDATGKLSSFTDRGGTGTGKLPVAIDFPIGGTIYRYIDTNMAANQQNTVEKNLYYTYFNVNIRYSMCNYGSSRVPSGARTEYYMKVTVDRAAGTYRPALNTTVNDHIVTGSELEAGADYIYLGASAAASAKYLITFAFDNPLLHYDGQRLMPYGTWLANTLQAAMQRLRAFADSTTTINSDAALNNDYNLEHGLTAAEQAALTLDLVLCATLFNTSAATRIVEVWIETGTYDEGTWQSVDVLASGQVFLSSKGTAQVSLSASVDGPQTQATHVQARFSADGQGVELKHSTFSGKASATVLRVRRWT